MRFVPVPEEQSAILVNRVCAVHSCHRQTSENPQVKADVGHSHLSVLVRPFHLRSREPLDDAGRGLSVGRFLHGKRGTDRTDGTYRIRDCYIYMSDVTLGRYFPIVLYAGEAARSHQERVAGSVTVFLIVLAELIRDPHLVLLLCAYVYVHQHATRCVLERSQCGGVTLNFVKLHEPREEDCVQVLPLPLANVVRVASVSAHLEELAWRRKVERVVARKIMCQALLDSALIRPYHRD